MSDHEFHGWADSPGIIKALRTREPRDIAVVICDRCGSVSYYNQGLHCACEHCEANLDHLIDSDAGEVITLDDHLECLAEQEGMP